MQAKASWLYSTSHVPGAVIRIPFSKYTTMGRHEKRQAAALLVIGTTFAAGFVVQ